MEILISFLATIIYFINALPLQASDLVLIIFRPKIITVYIVSAILHQMFYSVRAPTPAEMFL